MPTRTTLVDSDYVLTIAGAVANPLALDFAAFEAMPNEAKVTDVSRFRAGRSGDAVLLDAVLARAEPAPDANYATLHADRDDFHVSVPLADLRSEGLIVYRDASGPLSLDQGGPIRFLIRNPAACNTGELDECANVKYLSCIELTTRKGRDTRPTTEADHAGLHAKES